MIKFKVTSVDRKNEESYNPCGHGFLKVFFTKSVSYVDSCTNESVKYEVEYFAKGWISYAYDYKGNRLEVVRAFRFFAKTDNLWTERRFSQEEKANIYKSINRQLRSAKWSALA